MFIQLGEIVEKDCKPRGLNREDALNHSRWRKQIRMIDDHNECEWVNVSSGTGSPGLLFWCSALMSRFWISTRKRQVPGRQE